MSPTPWVVVDSEKQAFVCKRCGDVAGFRLPLPVEVLVGWCQVFADLHGRCEEC